MEKLNLKSRDELAISTLGTKSTQKCTCYYCAGCLGCLLFVFFVGVVLAASVAGGVVAAQEGD